jgi:hypothetical protein
MVFIPLRAAALLAGLSVSFGPAASAQVGHNPAHSPYHDLLAKHQFTLTGGVLGGGGGKAGVGPRGGPLGGLRYSLTLSRPLEFTVAVYGAWLTRHLVDPTAPVGQRNVGTAPQFVGIGDVGFNLRITGAKTWHGLVPYVGASLGIASGSAVIQDNSSFTFHQPFQFGPHLGIRYYSRGSISLWVEGWDPIWRLHYPNVYFSGSTPVLDVSNGTRQWVHNPTLLVGLGISR